MLDPDHLARLDLFAPLAPAERAALAAHLQEQAFPRGAMIFAEGDPSHVAWFVAAGRVKVCRFTPGGQEHILGVFGPGEPVGLVAVLEGRPYPASAVAATDARAWRLGRDDLQRLMAAYPAIGRALLRATDQRMLQLIERLHGVATQSIRQRLAEYLLSLAAGQPAGGPAYLQVPLTQEELGAYLGASRETISRLFSELRRQGALTPAQAGTWALDREALQRWLEGP